ncbi:ABC transporter ATP-binding protein/permease [Bacteriovoracales bacterium]|nr:ABC transporter ATP-binding protein/permease [Bacteriovoracales bacterium]
MKPIKLFRTTIEKLSQLRELLGKDIIKLLFFSVLIGFFLFGAEFLFVYGLQGFLREIGVSSEKNVSLPSFYPKGLIPSLLIFFLLGITRVITQILKSYIGGIANQAFTRKQRDRFFTYSIENANKVSSHEIVSLFTDTLARASSSILDFTGLIITITSACFLFISGLLIAPKEMALGIFLGFIFLIPTKKFNPIVDDSGKGLTKSWENVTKLLIEGIKHNYFFKAHGLVPDLLKKGKDSIAEYEKFYKKFYFYSSLKNGSPNIVGIILICIISFFSINYFMTKGATLLAFLYLFIRLSQGIAEIFVTSSSLRLNIVSIKDLLLWNKKIEPFLLNFKNKSTNITDTKQLDSIFINLQNISFSFGDIEILKNINVQINKGDVLVIEGKSGVGKSTLVSIILGLLKPNKGTISLNNKDISSFSTRFKNSISYVGPEPFLFEGTLKENLLYGNPRAHLINDEEIKQAIELTKLTRYISNLSEGLDFKFEEHAEASTGQRQRLSLCRAFLRRPKLLILDEATANLDKTTEREIMDSITSQMKVMTTIIVTHKESLKKYGNKFLKLEQNLIYSYDEGNLSHNFN